MQLKWEKLLNPNRRKELHGSKESIGTGVGRKEIERDYDRILFATPTRRLADKTQVFPLEINDSVRTRLTHSHEVSNLARSIGIRLAFDYPHIFGDDHEKLEVKRNIPALLAAVGLAHDLGNPPFGHQGELAIQQWFQNEDTEENPVELDFCQFDGNAQTFRLLTRLQVLNDEFGLNLTCATLAALVKYPSIYGSNRKGGFKKYGIFRSEEKIISEVWEQTGLSEGIRHPLAYVMEACDDIAYSVIDAEDIVKKGYASFYDLMDYLDDHTEDPVISSVVAAARKKNSEFKKEGLSSKELNDISMQMFRVKAISEMVLAATEVFVDSLPKMMEGTIPPGFELMKNSKCKELCGEVKEFDRRYGFQHKDVLKLELKGSNHIKRMVKTLWSAVSKGDDSGYPFERYVYGEISENYRRVYEASKKDQYAKYQLVCDAISGMTESYLIRKNEEYQSLENV